MPEASDINDSEILSKTTQETDGKGNIRFKLVLPSGKPLVSEYLIPDNQKKGLRLWLDAVRTAWVQDVEDLQAEKRRKAASNADMDQKGAKIETQDLTRQLKAVDKPVDACDHAKNQVRLLEAEEAHWLAEYQRAEKHLATTRKQLRKWQTIVASLDAGEDNE